MLGSNQSPAQGGSYKAIAFFHRDSLSLHFCSSNPLLLHLFFPFLPLFLLLVIFAVTLLLFLHRVLLVVVLLLLHFSSSFSSFSLFFLVPYFLSPPPPPPRFLILFVVFSLLFLVLVLLLPLASSPFPDFSMVPSFRSFILCLLVLFFSF